MDFKWLREVDQMAENDDLLRALAIVKAYKLLQRFWTYVGPPTPERCELWTGGHNRGYGIFAISHRESVRASRFIYALRVGELRDDQLVLHKCDNPSCVNVDHLFLGSAADNAADRNAKGRTARGAKSGARLHPEKLARGLRSGAHTHPEMIRRGEQHGRAKLTTFQVARIRERLKAGDKAPQIARELGVGRTTVYQIGKGQTWKQT